MPCCGGWTKQNPSDVDAHLIEVLKNELKGKNLELVKVTGFQTQVVAGINYMFEVETNNGPHKLIIWGKLDRTYVLTQFE